MEYTIFGKADKVDFAPGSAVEEVLQNVRTLLATKKFSVPLDRALGLDFTVLDQPLPKAQAGMRVEIIEAIRKHEPRARVRRVDFSGEGIDGRLVPKVTVSVDV